MDAAPEGARRGRRVVVVGSTGSGKTTFARRLAARLGLPHIELDALHWDPNWTPVPPERFRERVAGAIGLEGWVVDGNYSAARALIWARADTLVWLDYRLPLVLLRLFRREVARIATRQELWSGNRTSFRVQFLSDKSLFLWALRTWPRYRREYPELLRRPEHAHLVVHRFRSPRAAERWLRAIVPARTPLDDPRRRQPSAGCRG